MAVKHINENAKEESGILLSGKDAKKVFSMFSSKRNSSDINNKKSSLKSLFSASNNLPTLVS